MAPKVNMSDVEQDLSNQSLHLTYHYILWTTTFTINYSGFTRESFYSSSSAPIETIHRCLFS
jgi:hypothetical protein